MNMTVVDKRDNEKYKVYDITYDRAGYPHFLIYKEGQWLCVSAKHFVPPSIYFKKDIEEAEKALEECVNNIFR